MGTRLCAVLLLLGSVTAANATTAKKAPSGSAFLGELRRGADCDGEIVRAKLAQWAGREIAFDEPPFAMACTAYVEVLLADASPTNRAELWSRIPVLLGDRANETIQLYRDDLAQAAEFKREGAWNKSLDIDFTKRMAGGLDQLSGLGASLRMALDHLGKLCAAKSPKEACDARRAFEAVRTRKAAEYQVAKERAAKHESKEARDADVALAWQLYGPFLDVPPAQPR